MIFIVVFQDACPSPRTEWIEEHILAVAVSILFNIDEGFCILFCCSKHAVVQKIQEAKCTVDLRGE